VRANGRCRGRRRGGVDRGAAATETEIASGFHKAVGLAQDAAGTIYSAYFVGGRGKPPAAGVRRGGQRLFLVDHSLTVGLRDKLRILHLAAGAGG
jgi:hypothetical protein